MNEHSCDHPTRRTFLQSLAALAVVSPVLAQSGRAPIPVHGLNHMTLAVSDPQRSLEFYQGLFGMPIQARQGRTPCLRIGAGPQFMALTGGGANVMPEINHFCLTVEGFDADRLMQSLESAWRGAGRRHGPRRVQRWTHRWPDACAGPDP